MNNKYILVIDQGTTSTRAIIFNQLAEIIACSQLELTQLYPNDGWIEHNPEEIWETVYQTVKGVLNKADLTIKDILSIGITNQRETTVLWDKVSGKAVYNAIVWQSRQSQAICEEWIEAGYEKIVKEKTGLIINPYFSSSKIKWILDFVPGVRNKAERGEILFGTIDSYLVWKLTEGKVHITDYTNASRTMIFNITTLDWDNDLLNLFNIPKSILPSLCSNSEIIGYATCFDKKVAVPIASIIGDQQSALFGQCCFNKGDVKSTYGTGCFILMNTLDEVIASQSGLLTTIAWVINQKVDYALEGSVFIGGAAIQWLRDGLHFFKKSCDCEKYISQYNVSNGIYVVPAFVGLGAPHWDNDVRGTIFGITRSTTREHLIAGVLEGIAFQVMDVMEVMKEEAKVITTYLGVDGGAAVNNYLMQFQADVLDVKLIRPYCLETTALGTMYLAGLTMGLFKNLDEIKKKHRVEQVFIRHMNDFERQKRITGWEKAVQATKVFK